MTDFSTLRCWLIALRVNAKCSCGIENPLVLRRNSSGAVCYGCRQVARGLPRKGEIADEKRGEIQVALARLQKRVADIAALDFFHARSREAVDGLLKELEQKLAAREPEKGAAAAEALEKPRGATWVTRTGIHVARMASTWLIRRFIDPKEKFKFVAARE